MNELMSDEGDCRSAPATPGLLKIYKILVEILEIFKLWLLIGKWDMSGCHFVQFV